MRELQSFKYDSPENIAPIGYYAEKDGIRYSDLVVISGEASSGKTTLAMNMAVRGAKAGDKVYFISFEYTNNLVANRLYTIAGSYDLPIFVEDVDISTFGQTISCIGNAILTQGVRIVIIDGLHTVSNEPQYASRVLKCMAVDKNVCIIVTTQILMTSDHIPTRQNIINFNIEVPDVFFLVNRPEMYNCYLRSAPDLNPKGLIEIFCEGRRMVGEYFIERLNKMTGVLERL